MKIGRPIERIWVNGIESKKCPRCHLVKPLTEFYRLINGLYWGGCKECDRKRKISKPKAIKPKTENELLLVNGLRRCSMCHEIKSINEFGLYPRGTYRSQCHQCENDRNNKWNKSHRDYLRPIARKRMADRMSTDPSFKLNSYTSMSIGASLRGKKSRRHWETLVGYTLSDLMIHLKRNFVDGMSWANYGEWHIDHKIPVSKFNFISPDDIDFKRCWALENLRPMWAVDNMRKSSKIDHPFQPALRIAI